MSFSLYFYNFKKLETLCTGCTGRYTYDLYTTGCRTGPAVSCRICIMYHTLYHVSYIFSLFDFVAGILCRKFKLTVRVPMISIVFIFHFHHSKHSHLIIHLH